MDLSKILLANGADARIKNSDGQIAAEVIPDVDSDEGRVLYEYLKKQEEERAELEMAFKRAHVEGTNSDNDDDDDDEEEEDGEEG
jgi:hypothetical protein